MKSLLWIPLNPIWIPIWIPIPISPYRNPSRKQIHDDWIQWLHGSYQDELVWQGTDAVPRRGSFGGGAWSIQELADTYLTFKYVIYIYICERWRARGTWTDFYKTYMMKVRTEIWSNCFNLRLSLTVLHLFTKNLLSSRAILRNSKTDTKPSFGCWFSMTRHGTRILFFAICVEYLLSVYFYILKITKQRTSWVMLLIWILNSWGSSEFNGSSPSWVEKTSIPWIGVVVW